MPGSSQARTADASVWPYDPLVLDPKVFKAYDIRGIHPTELDEDGAYRIGRAYVEHFEPRRIAVGRDMRLAAPAMTAALIEGAADGGADVLDLGLVGTEMVYYAVGELELDGGVCVTASHNPKEYTGMKIVRRGALPVGGDSGLDDVRRGADQPFGAVARRGDVTQPMCGTGSSRRCSRSSTRRPSGPSGSSSTPRTAWPGRCCRRCSSAFPQLESWSATSSPTGPFRTTSRTRCSRRTARSSSRRRARRGQTSASRTTATPTAASSSTTPASSSPATSSRHSSRRRCSPRSPVPR